MRHEYLADQSMGRTCGRRKAQDGSRCKLFRQLDPWRSGDQLSWPHKCSQIQVKRHCFQASWGAGMGFEYAVDQRWLHSLQLHSPSRCVSTFLKSQWKRGFVLQNLGTLSSQKWLDIHPYNHLQVYLLASKAYCTRHYQSNYLFSQLPLTKAECLESWTKRL